MAVVGSAECSNSKLSVVESSECDTDFVYSVSKSREPTTTRDAETFAPVAAQLTEEELAELDELAVVVSWIPLPNVFCLQKASKNSCLGCLRSGIS